MLNEVFLNIVKLVKLWSKELGICGVMIFKDLGGNIWREGVVIVRIVFGFLCLGLLLFEFDLLIICSKFNIVVSNFIYYRIWRFIIMVNN